MARKKAAKKSAKKVKPQNPDNPARLITPPFRVSFPHVFQPNPRQTDKEQYDVCMLFPKDDTNLDHINAAIDAVVDEKCKGKKKGLKMPIRDGDDDPAFEDYQESHEGMHVLSARTTFKPGLVDKNLEDIIDPGDFYSGCWARASITAFHYDTAGNKGISFSLNNIQKLKDDDPFTSAGLKASAEFDEVESDDDEEESEDQYDVDDDGFAIDEDGEWIVDEDDNYLNADGVPVDDDCEPLEDEDEEDDEEDEEEDAEDDEEEGEDEEEEEEEEDEEEDEDEDW